MSIILKVQTGGPEGSHCPDYIEGKRRLMVESKS
jgi:hypothetical protein